MDADVSGFYMLLPSIGVQQKTCKYDQNKSYKSFYKSGLFNGFPRISAIFNVDKNFSEFSMSLTRGIEPKGLLYIEYETLTLELMQSMSKTCNKLYYEGSGWFPIEIVKHNYETYGINPFVKQYAYASHSFQIDFSDMTNDQFRTFLGKCISQSYDEVWRTRDYNEHMRARYLLRSRIVSITDEDYDGMGTIFSIKYKTEKPPWNMGIVSAYVKAHQKFNLMTQYNKLVENGIKVLAISVDSIETNKECHNLFDIGTEEGQWKIEKTKTNAKTDPFVIQRKQVLPQTSITNFTDFSKDKLLPKFLHISGAGGNGKTQYIVNLSKSYKTIMYVAPTTSSVKNLLDRAKDLNVKIECDTYHRVFAVGCEDKFNRDKYDIFVLDEVSMVSADMLGFIISKLKPHQSLILSGDSNQLPPVESIPIFEDEIYNQFEVLELTKNYRQQLDPDYFQLCNMLRKPMSKQEAIEFLNKINERVVSKENLPSFDSLDDAYICGINEQVNMRNKSINSGDLKVGDKVICNTTCHDLENKKVPNGSIGIIIEITPKFKVRWADETESTFKCAGKTKSKNKANNSRFTLAYATTVHKIQGTTLKGNLIIDPSRLFSLHHLYVALTRAVSFKNIYLTEPITFNILKKTTHIIGFPKPVHQLNKLKRLAQKYRNEDPNLTECYFKKMLENQQNLCFYCHCPMTLRFGLQQSLTIDRFRDDDIHRIGNVCLSCHGCNSSHANCILNK